MQNDEKGVKTPKRNRYWSVMLVGDHGRVIPFRHFKALIVGVGIILIGGLTASIVLGIVCSRQRQIMGDLSKNLAAIRAQVSKFRDEKDLCLTELIALKKQTGELPKTAPGVAVPLKERALKTTDPGKEKALKIQQEEPAKKAAAPVKWSADIRKFNVSYDNRQKILRAEFRIYNTSRPKKRLSGRTVVVFKEQGDPPNHWAAVPLVPVRDGKPVGGNGKTFKINNFRTEKFKVLRGKDSAEFNTASIYIYNEQGKLIANQDQPFNVDYAPPAPAKPVAPKPVVDPEPSPVSPDVRQVGDPLPPQTQSDDSVPPVTPSSPAQSPQQESVNPADDNSRAEPVDPVIPPTIDKTPATEAKPAIEGGE